MYFVSTTAVGITLNKKNFGMIYGNHIYIIRHKTMKEIKRLLNYLKNLWGILALSVIALPASMYLAKVSLYPENSKISALYGAVPSLASAFLLLLLTTFKYELKELKTARKVSVIAALIAFGAIFLFITVKVVLLDIDYTREIGNLSRGTMTQLKRSSGIMQKEELDPNAPEGELKLKQMSGDPWDIVALFALTISVSGFTCCFGVLGINSYMNKETEQADSVRPR